MDQALESGAIKIDGNKEAFTDFLGLLDTLPLLVQHRDAISELERTSLSERAYSYRFREVRLWHLADVDADAQHVRFQG